MKLYYENDCCEFYLGDSTKELTSLHGREFDLIYADPPYFLSTGGITCRSGKQAPVDKGKWDRPKNVMDIIEFNDCWLTDSYHCLKDKGALWVSGTYHNIYSIGYTLMITAFKIVQDIIWYKPNAPPAILGKNFQATHENLIWAVKDGDGSKTFNYQLMKNWDVDCDLIGRDGKQMRSIWAFPTEYTPEHHPAQKPVELLSRIIGACTNLGDKVLDPFLGSGTTAVVCKQRGRYCVGIDNNEEYLDMAIRRYEETEYLGNFEEYNEGFGKWLQ